MGVYETACQPEPSPSRARPEPAFAVETLFCSRVAFSSTSVVNSTAVSFSQKYRHSGNEIFMANCDAATNVTLLGVHRSCPTDKWVSRQMGIARTILAFRCMHTRGSKQLSFHHGETFVPRTHGGPIHDGCMQFQRSPPTACSGLS